MMLNNVISNAYLQKLIRPDNQTHSSRKCQPHTHAACKTLEQIMTMVAINYWNLDGLMATTSRVVTA